MHPSHLPAGGRPSSPRRPFHFLIFPIFITGGRLHCDLEAAALGSSAPWSRTISADALCTPSLPTAFGRQRKATGTVRPSVRLFVCLFPLLSLVFVSVLFVTRTRIELNVKVIGQLDGSSIGACRRCNRLANVSD